MLKYAAIIHIFLALLTLPAAALTANAFHTTPSNSLEFSGPQFAQATGKYKFTATDLQTALQKLGYYKGRVDGQLGPASKRAWIQFTRDFNLPDKSLSPANLAKLIQAVRGQTTPTNQAPPANDDNVAKVNRIPNSYQITDFSDIDPDAARTLNTMLAKYLRIQSDVSRSEYLSVFSEILQLRDTILTTHPNSPVSIAIASGSNISGVDFSSLDAAYANQLVSYYEDICAAEPSLQCFGVINYQHFLDNCAKQTPDFSNLRQTIVMTNNIYKTIEHNDHFIPRSVFNQNVNRCLAKISAGYNNPSISAIADHFRIKILIDDEQVSKARNMIENSNSVFVKSSGALLIAQAEGNLSWQSLMRINEYLQDHEASLDSRNIRKISGNNLREALIELSLSKIFLRSIAASYYIRNNHDKTRKPVDFSDRDYRDLRLANRMSEHLYMHFDFHFNDSVSPKDACFGDAAWAVFDFYVQMQRSEFQATPRDQAFHRFHIDGLNSIARGFFNCEDKKIAQMPLIVYLNAGVLLEHGLSGSHQFIGDFDIRTATVHDIYDTYFDVMRPPVDSDSLPALVNENSAEQFESYEEFCHAERERASSWYLNKNRYDKYDILRRYVGVNYCLNVAFTRLFLSKCSDDGANSNRCWIGDLIGFDPAYPRYLYFERLLAADEVCSASTMLFGELRNTAYFNKAIEKLIKHPQMAADWNCGKGSLELLLR